MMRKRSRRRRRRRQKRRKKRRKKRRIKRPGTNEPSRNLSTKPVVAYSKSARIVSFELSFWN